MAVNDEKLASSELKPRTKALLESVGASTFGHIEQMCEADPRIIRGFGRGSLRDLRNALQRRGLRFANERDDFNPDDRAWYDTILAM